MHYLEDDAQPYKRLSGATWEELLASIRASPSGSFLGADNLAVAAAADRYEVHAFGGDEPVLATDARIISRCLESYLWHVRDNLNAIHRLLTHPDTLNEGRIYYGIVGVHHRAVVESSARLIWLTSEPTQEERLTRYWQMLDNDGRMTAKHPLALATATADVTSLQRSRQPVKKAVAVGGGSAVGKKNPTSRDVVRASFGDEMVVVYDKLSQFVHHSVNQDDILSGAPFSRGLKGVGADDYDAIHRDFDLRTITSVTKTYAALSKYVGTAQE
ncbi:MAG: hypothetical protein J0H96_13015 [Microbacterium ginsengisoli]|nr:hypothetical protein [Microbacterium ginsengisoli]